MMPDRTGRAEVERELGVLLATVRDDVDACRRALRRDIRWPLLGMLAEQEKATPVLHRMVRAALADAHPPDIDPRFVAHLGRVAIVTEFRLLELEQRLERLLPALQAEGIPALLLKGAALWRSVYDSPLDRPMGDVDLLVPPGHAEPSWAVARTLGWDRRPDLPPEGAYRDHHHLPPMADGVGMELGLEIHTDIFPHANPFDLSAGALWRDSTPAKDGIARVPAPEHLLLHAALHFAWSHACSFGVWRTLRDVDRLVAQGTIDWDAFVRTAIECRGSAGAFWVLHLAREWAGVPIDERVLDALRPGSSRLLEKVFRRHLAHRSLPPEGMAWPIALERQLWEAAMRPRTLGHGAIRPWAGAGKWEVRGDGGGAAGTSARKASRARKATDGARYLVRLVTGM